MEGLEAAGLGDRDHGDEGGGKNIGAPGGQAGEPAAFLQRERGDGR